MSAAFQLAPGTVFGTDFRIVKPLSAGGMGAVYVAEQSSTGKLRALKLMHPQLVANTKLRERFTQEARVGALVQSDHVVQVIGAGIDGPTGIPWLAMELLEGEDLAAFLQRKGIVSLPELHEIFRQLCHALGAAHRASVIHRDMKPENIFLAKTHSATEPNCVKVLDFGIAKVAAEAKTMATANIGTPLWMAPEQTDPNARLTSAVDVWPLGLIAFTLLTGRIYWKAANQSGGIAIQVLLREMLFEPIAAASVRAAEFGCAGTIPPGFDAWFAKCVVREVPQRFANATDAFAALGQMMSSLSRPVGSVAITPPNALGQLPMSVSANTSLAAFSGTAPTQAAFSHTATAAAQGAMATAGAQAPLAQGMMPTAQQPWSAQPTNMPNYNYVPQGTPGFIQVGTDAPVMGTPAQLPMPAHLPRRRGLVTLLIGSLLGALVVGGALFLFLRDKPSPRVTINVPAPTTSEPDTSQQTTQPVTIDPTTTATATPRGKLSLRKVGTEPTSATPAGDPLASEPPKPAAPRQFDFAAANRSLQEKTNLARNICRGKSGPKAISVTVYFNKLGTVQRILSDPMLASKESSLCVTSTLSSARVPAFDEPNEKSMGWSVGLD